MPTPVVSGNGWLRYCPKCGAEIYCSLFHNAKAAIEKGRLCKACGAKKSARSGVNNGFYGRRHSEQNLEKMRAVKIDAFIRFSPEYREKALQILHEGRKIRQASGLNTYEHMVIKYGESEALKRWQLRIKKTSLKNRGSGNPMYGKPTPHRAGNGWQGYYNGQFFRSLRELAFMTRNPKAISGEANYWRATYEIAGIQRTTVPDFILEDERFVIECKPIKLHETPTVQAKASAMRALCSSRGYQYKLVDPEILPYSELVQLIDSGAVELTERTKEKMKKWLS